MMGLSPAFLMGCRKAGLRPGDQFNLSRMRSIGVAGSPLPPEGFDWIYEQLGADVLLNNGSGGTDVCTGIVQGGPLLPVYRGEISGPCLGVDVWSETGLAGRRKVVGRRPFATRRPDRSPNGASGRRRLLPGYDRVSLAVHRERRQLSPVAVGEPLGAPVAAGESNGGAERDGVAVGLAPNREQAAASVGRDEWTGRVDARGRDVARLKIGSCRNVLS